MGSDSVVSGEGFAGRGGSNYTGKARGESSYQRYDFQQLAGWAEQILPLSLLLLVVFIRQHLQDMGSTKWIGFRCIRGLIVEGSAGGGSSNRNARGESLYERCDIQQLTGWAEHILPSSLLLLVAFIRQHLQGLPIILQIRKISAPTTVEVLWINVSGAFSCNCTTFAAKDVLVVLN